MIITSKKLENCKICHKQKGVIFEKYNGEVKVLCSCDTNSHLEKFIVCLEKDKFSWGRGSKYFNENRKLMYKQKNY